MANLQLSPFAQPVAQKCSKSAPIKVRQKTQVRAIDLGFFVIYIDSRSGRE